MSEKERVFREVMLYGKGDLIFVGVLPFLPAGGKHYVVIAQGFAFALEERFGRMRVVRSGFVLGGRVILETEEIDTLH